MPDVQILRAPASGVPSDYTVPGSGELRLKAVYAEFDGSGAGGPFLPCVTIISDSGDVIGRAVDQGVSVTAGSNADVTWFPGVKPAAAAAAAGALDYLLLLGAGQTVLDPPIGDSDHGKFVAATAQSNNLGSFTFVLDAGGKVKEVDSTVPGRYQSICNFEWSNPVVATDLAVIANMFGAGPISMSPAWFVRSQTTDIDGYTQAFSNLPAGTIQMTIEPSISGGDATLGFNPFYWWILRFPT
jgi:hypothetical protein